MKKQNLTSFQFSVSAAEKDVIQNGVTGKTVQIPHTWNVENGTEEYFGTAWYSTEFETEKLSFKTVLLFHAVYRDCTVYVNGNEVAKHFNSGFTPFEADITNHIKIGTNLLVIKCSNAYSDDALPHGKDFDWANDGGIIRPVELIEYGENDIEHIKIESTVTDFLEDGKGKANIVCDFDFCCKKNLPFSVYVKEKKSGKPVFEKENICGNRTEFCLSDITLWNTENPFLYTLEIVCGNETRTQAFGVRKIEVRKDKIYLNNRPIALRGVEWMPGSNPEFGMAEPESELRKNLEMLKDINCNFTRFHWQQDDFVYDWCDEHGLMVQEEIPYWGSPKNAGENQLAVAKKQADEMLLHHFNHPSVVCWGVGNELGGRQKGTIFYVKQMVAYFKRKDTMRLVNYVSNTMGRKSFWQRLGRSKDATVYGDICMWNEYLGTWYGDVNYDKVFRLVQNESKGKPLVSTEFGLCEPHFKGGDKRRIEIYKEKLDYYKKYNFAGWVYFSLNDYRTHVGESGKGKLKQRIHGSVDLYGNKKPSYEFIKCANQKETKE
ncbi:MAG: glycoside hydrolase family 2 protein [Acutalibacteraceae bacterium]